MTILGLAQVGAPANDDLESMLRQTFEKAAKHKVDLLIFPEGLTTWWQKTPEEYRDTAEPLDGAFYTLVSSLCCEFELACIYCCNEYNTGDNLIDSYEEKTTFEPGIENMDTSQEGPLALPFNTAVVVDKGGSLVGSYRKIHLFRNNKVNEADHNAGGHEYMEPADLGFARVGLGICYDLRFPQLARSAALQGAQILAYPAAWYDGPNKLDHWKTLLAARAIENELFTIGVCRSDSNCVGHSCVFGPRGELIAEASTGEQVLIAEIDLEAVASARAAIPVLEYTE